MTVAFAIAFALVGMLMLGGASDGFEPDWSCFAGGAVLVVLATALVFLRVLS